MDATIMPSTNSLLSKLKSDFPAFQFAKGESFQWSSSNTTIYYADTRDTASLLHETAHAILGHQRYSSDIELLQMERDAWHYAQTTLAKEYAVTIDEEAIESMLDTYRDWLHERSLCPSCDATGVQTAPSTYTCLACSGSWRVNEARSCALRRYKQK